MEPALHPGDHLAVSWLAALPVEEGDIVTYTVRDGGLSYTYVSRIREIVEADGERTLHLQPDGESPPDSPLRGSIGEDEVTGRVLGIFLPKEVTSGWERVGRF